MQLDLHQTIIEADAAELCVGTDVGLQQILSEAVKSHESEPLVYLDVGAAVVAFPWGQEHHLGTACYWVEQAKRAPQDSTYQLGRNLREELAACLLGGHGVRAAMGLAAFTAVREEGLLQEGASPATADIEAVLTRPLKCPGGRLVRYRFPRQRAVRLARCLQILAHETAPTEPRALRAWLLGLPGIGPKTASWIVRNHTGTDEVAIIDIHLRRAGLAAGFFRPEWRLPRDYSAFELSFLAVARLGGVSAAALDAYIWDELQYLGDAGSAVLGREIAAFG